MASCAQRLWNDTETGDCSSNGTDVNRCNNATDKDGKQCAFQNGSCQTLATTCPTPVVQQPGVVVRPGHPQGRYYGICPEIHMQGCMNDANKTTFTSRDNLCPNMYDLYPSQDLGIWKPLIATTSPQHYAQVNYNGFSDFGNACHALVYMSNDQQKARNNLFYGINWYPTVQTTVGRIRPMKYNDVTAAIQGKRSTFADKTTVNGVDFSVDDLNMQSFASSNSFEGKKERPIVCSRCPAGFIVSGVRTYGAAQYSNAYQPTSVQVICKDALNMTSIPSNDQVADGNFVTPLGNNGFKQLFEQRCDTYVTGFAFNGDSEMNGMHIRCATDDEWNAFIQARNTYQFKILDPTCVGQDTKDQYGLAVASDDTVKARANPTRQSKCAQYASSQCAQPANSGSTYCKCLNATQFKADMDGSGVAIDIPRSCTTCLTASSNETWMDYKFANKGDCPQLQISNCIVKNNIQAGGTVTLDHNQVTQNCDNRSQINVGQQEQQQPSTPPPTPTKVAPAAPPSITAPVSQPMTLPPLPSNPFVTPPTVSPPPPPPPPTTTTSGKKSNNYFAFILLLVLAGLAYLVVS